MEVIKTGNPDKAAANLSFLLDAGLITTKPLVEKLRTFVTGLASGSGPSLPAPTATTYSFPPGTTTAPPTQGMVQENLDNYIAFLKKLGFAVDTNATVSVIRKPNWPYAEYESDPKVLIVSSNVSSDPDILRLTISDAILEKPGMNRLEDGVGPDGKPVLQKVYKRSFFIEKGVDQYLVASFAERAQLEPLAAALRHLPEPYVHDLTIHRQYPDLVKLENLPDEDGNQAANLGEYWSSLFWEVKNCLGSMETDKIVSQAWLLLPWPTSDATIDLAFMKTFLMEARSSLPTPATLKVLAIIKAQGFPTAD